MLIKKTNYRYSNTYALYYKSNNTLYLNKNFVGDCKIIILNCAAEKASRKASVRNKKSERSHSSIT